MHTLERDVSNLPTAGRIVLVPGDIDPTPLPKADSASNHAYSIAPLQLPHALCLTAS